MVAVLDTSEKMARAMYRPSVLKGSVTWMTRPSWTKSVLTGLGAAR
jgi:hypothetical protein